MKISKIVEMIDLAGSLKAWTPQEYRWNGMLSFVECFRWDPVEQQGWWIYKNGESSRSSITLERIQQLCRANPL